MVEFVAGLARLEIAGKPWLAFVPLARFQPLVEASHALGSRYVVDTQYQQSISKRIFFEETLRDAYANLNEDDERFLNAAHYRDWVKISCGYATVAEQTYDSVKEAQGAVLMARKIAPYSIADRKGTVVKIFTARSTSPQEMGGREFAECVEKCTAFAANMIGVKPKELTAQHAKDKLNPALQGTEAPDGREGAGTPVSSLPGSIADSADPPTPNDPERLNLPDAGAPGSHDHPELGDRERPTSTVNAIRSLAAPAIDPSNYRLTGLPAPSKEAAAAERLRLARDLAISALPMTDGIDAVAEGEATVHQWLRASVIEFLEEANPVEGVTTKRGARAIKARGVHGRVMFFKIDG
jgi:hypothetical protein